MSIGCRARVIQTGSLQGQGCRCLNDHCHYCDRTVAGDVCRRCRDGWYLLDRQCIQSCPAEMASSGVGLWGRRCLPPFTCQSRAILGELGEGVSFGCKCANEGNTAIADCHRCEHRAGEYGQHCVRCNAGKFLLHNRCVDDCSDAGLAAYIPGGSFGRECREVFICADGVDREGAPCRCPKAAGAGCLACAWTMAGSECIQTE